MAYKVPFVNYKEHYKSMETEIDGAIKRVLTNGDLILRQDVQEFEENMAKYLGVDYAVGVSSCTDALQLSLLSAGIARGDEVITVAHTFLATIAAIVHCGATPVIVDVSEDYCMNTDLIEAAITKRTKAILPVHLNGRLCNMEKIMALAKKYNLHVIEDSAQALGATFDGRKGGSWGIAGCFSFYPAKLLGACGDAGLVSTNDPEIARKIKLYRDHGRETKDTFAFYGFTGRLDNLQAALLNVKFKYLSSWIERRRKIAKLYYEGLADVDGIILPPMSGGRHDDVFQNYVIRAGRRDELLSYLRENGVEVMVSNPIPINRQPKLPLNHFKLPITERLAAEVISIPMIPELSDDQVGYVIQTIRKFYFK